MSHSVHKLRIFRRILDWLVPGRTGLLNIYANCDTGAFILGSWGIWFKKVGKNDHVFQYDLTF